MIRSPLILMLAVAICFTSHATGLPAAEPELDWETANRQRMFVVANDKHRIAAIVVDTTHTEGLQVATRLQELVFRLSGARLPIVDREFVTVPWGNIHLQWDYHPMQAQRPPYTITMKHDDVSSFNPPKQIMITGSPPASMEEAVSTFTKSAFGMPLSAIDDKQFEWQRRDTLAIPEDFEVEYPQREE